MSLDEIMQKIRDGKRAGKIARGILSDDRKERVRSSKQARTLSLDDQLLIEEELKQMIDDDDEGEYNAFLDNLYQK